MRGRGGVIVASVSAGTGHVRAAEAVVEAIRIADPRTQAVHVNVLEHARPGFRKLYEGGYAFLVNKAPSAWAQIYKWSDRENVVVDRMLERLQQRQTRDFLQIVRDLAPRRVIATHFLLPQLLEALPPAECPPVDVVVTDFDVHRLWKHPIVDRYFVASELAACRLAASGISPRRIILSGIPIHPIFLRPVDGGAVRRDLGLTLNDPVVLLVAGGQGFGALDRAVAGLLAAKTPLQIISVAGRNERLRSAVDKLPVPGHIRLRSLGFVGNMHELMAAADLVVTKPGGLTVSEGLARGAALVLHSAIPGQEEKNADHVVRRGAGIRVDNFRKLPDTVLRLLQQPEWIASLRANAVACGKPRAAFQVADAALPLMAAG